MRLEEEKQTTTHHDGLGFLVFAGCRRPGQAERGLELSLHLCTDHHTSQERVHITVTTTQQSDQLYNKHQRTHNIHHHHRPRTATPYVWMNGWWRGGRRGPPPARTCGRYSPSRKYINGLFTLLIRTAYRPAAAAAPLAGHRSFIHPLSLAPLEAPRRRTACLLLPSIITDNLQFTNNNKSQ